MREAMFAAFITELSSLALDQVHGTFTLNVPIFLAIGRFWLRGSAPKREINSSCEARITQLKPFG